MNQDWFVVQGGDGFHCKVDPTDPNIVYGTLQYGVLARFDRRTGTRVQIQPQPEAGELPPRWNWDSPLTDLAAQPAAALLRGEHAVPQRRPRRLVEGR